MRPAGPFGPVGRFLLVHQVLVAEPVREYRELRHPPPVRCDPRDLRHVGSGEREQLLRLLGSVGGVGEQVRVGGDLVELAVGAGVVG